MLHNDSPVLVETSGRYRERLQLDPVQWPVTQAPSFRSQRIGLLAWTGARNIHVR